MTTRAGDRSGIVEPMRPSATQSGQIRTRRRTSNRLAPLLKTLGLQRVARHPERLRRGADGAAEEIGDVIAEADG